MDFNTGIDSRYHIHNQDTRQDSIPPTHTHTHKDPFLGPSVTSLDPTAPPRVMLSITAVLPFKDSI